MSIDCAKGEIQDPEIDARELFSMKNVSDLLRLMWFCAIVLFVAMTLIDPPFMEKRRARNDLSVKGSMRIIANAQGIFLEREPMERYGTIEELVSRGYLPESYRSMEKEGYRYELGLVVDGPYQYWLKVSPLEAGVTGQYCFFSNQSCRVFVSKTDFTVNAVTCMIEDGFTDAESSH